MSVAKLIERRSHLVPGKLRISELFFDVPKDHSSPSSGTLRIFARSVTKHETPAIPVSAEEAHKASQKPWFVYLQGGPGFGCRPPQSMGITKLILDRGYQMLYLDQRGTGLSTPISAATLALQGDAQAQADYLKLFRADSIVEDCELIRKTLTADFPAESKKWSVWGQSFGGFCGFTYLSKHPEGLREVFTTGGIPPIKKTAEEVYKATFASVIKRNIVYYNKFPGDKEIIHGLALFIRSKGGVTLPSGGLLTVRRLLSIGIAFGGSGGIDSVHDIILRMHSDIEQFKFLTRATLMAFEAMTGYDEAVIYSVLHESIYCENTASEWAADSVGKSFKEFRWLSEPTSPESVFDGQPLYFSGEMIFPFMFETYAELTGLKEVANILAKYKEWPVLYDEWQLARNEVPVYSASFVDDMYVNFDLVQEAAKKVKGCKQYITNTMYHDALRNNTDDVMKALFALRDDTLD